MFAPLVQTHAVQHVAARKSRAPRAARRSTAPELLVGHAGDAAEREAERITERVVGGESASPAGHSGAGTIQRKCAACENDEAAMSLARKAGDGSTAEAGRLAPPLVHDVLATPGTPLGGAERAFFEPRLGHDFAKVRVHADTAAAASARAVNARAYTVGNHVVLGDGSADRRLLAHELAHVVQQSAGARPMLRRQRKTVGGPLDLELDPCIDVLDHEACVHHLQALCEKVPDAPGCGFICRHFGCRKPSGPKTLCPTGWRAATSPARAGECCLGEIDSAQACCTPDRIAFAEGRCCPADTFVGGDGHCKSSRDVPQPSPGALCLPWQRTLSGKCCTPPLVPKGLECGPPEVKPPEPGGPAPLAPRLGVLWTDTIHFEQDQPGRGSGPVLTQAGAKELDAVLSWLRNSPDLDVRLIGSASWEGPASGREEYNQALAARRVAFVAKALGGFGSRVADPILGDGAESGCRSIGAGEWSCGASKAPPNSARPEDRVVRVTFARNKLTLQPAKLEIPTFRPKSF